MMRSLLKSLYIIMLLPVVSFAQSAAEIAKCGQENTDPQTVREYETELERIRCMKTLIVAHAQIQKGPYIDKTRRFAKESVLEKISKEKNNPEFVALIQKADRARQAERLNDEYIARFDVLANEYVALLAAFSKYKDSSNASAKALSFDPSADWRSLTVVSQNVVVVQNQESIASSKYETATLSLAQRIELTCLIYRSESASIDAEFRLNTTSLCVDGKARLEKVRSYAKTRGELFARRSEQTNESIDARIKTLSGREAAAAAEPARRDSIQLQSSAVFLEKARAAIQDRRKAATIVNGLPDLREQYGRWLSFQQYASVCSGKIVSWQETGCIALKEDLDTTNTLVKEFGSKILRYLPSSAGLTASETKIAEKIRTAVAANRTADALADYDALIAARGQK